jgi:hypothetical protein
MDFTSLHGTSPGSSNRILRLSSSSSSRERIGRRGKRIEVWASGFIVTGKGSRPMKRLCALFCFSGVMTGVVAQTVDFANDRMFATEADRKVYFADGTPVVGTNFVAQLYYGASASGLNPVLAPPRSFRDVPPTDPSAGTWFRATRTLTGFSVGQIVTLQIRAWDSTVADTYEQAATLNFLGTQHGTSATFIYQIPSAAVPPSGFYIENFRSFSLVPEPSVIGLVLLGVFGVLVLKRWA